MKKRLLCLLCAAALALAAACTPTGDVPTAPTPSPTPEVTPEPTLEPTPTPEPTPAPLTEERIRDRLAGEGYTLRSLVPWEEDYLVEAVYGGHGASSDDSFVLYWAYSTGEIVRLTGSEYITSYQILDRSYVKIHITGEDPNTPHTGLPATYTVRDYGRGVFTDSSRPDTWQSADESFYIGYLPDPLEERWHLVCDARVEVGGLSFSFSLCGGIAGSIGPPSCRVGTDPDTGRFTVRFYNTVLDSDDLPELPNLPEGCTTPDGNWSTDYAAPFPAGAWGGTISSSPTSRSPRTAATWWSPPSSSARTPSSP